METNKFIIKFMDVKVTFVDLAHLNEKSFWMIAHECRPVDNQYFNYSISFKSETECIDYYLKQARYATSWEWLMPVIDKIEELGYTFIYSKDDKCVAIADDKKIFRSDYVTGLRGRGKTKLESYYNAVITFIKQYYNDK